MTFIADREWFVSVSGEKKSNVVVIVPEAAVVDGVYVDIENSSVDQAGRAKPRFLPNLPFGGGPDVCLTIRVAPQLEPHVQHAVMGQQHVGPVRIKDPPRPGQVARFVIAMVAGISVLEKFKETSHFRGFLRVRSPVGDKSLT